MSPSPIRRALLGGLLATGLSGLRSARGDYDPRRLRIGFQKSAAVLTLLKAQGTLEPLFAPQGIELKWVEFPAGPQLLEGLNVGSIDFGYVGEAPPIFAQAAGADFVYVGYELPSPTAEAILVPHDSPLRSVAELKGKRIALNKGSNVHYLLVRLLEKAGVRYDDVQTVFLPPADARAAFERGSVEAWAIWEPFQSAAERQANARVLADGEGVVDNHNFFLARREFAEQRADAIRLLFEQVHRAGQAIKRDPAAAAQRLSPLQGLEPAVIEQAARRLSYSVQVIDGAVLRKQQKLADTFQQLKLIPRAIQVSDATLAHHA